MGGWLEAGVGGVFMSRYEGRCVFVAGVGGEMAFCAFVCFLMAVVVVAIQL